MNVDEYHARIQALRAEREQYGDWTHEPTIDDFCRICDEPTQDYRTDRLCELHHNAATDLSDNLRRLR